jgi:hypothetical protein
LPGERDQVHLDTASGIDAPPATLALARDSRNVCEILQNFHEKLRNFHKILRNFYKIPLKRKGRI